GCEEACGSRIASRSTSSLSPVRTTRGAITHSECPAIRFEATNSSHCIRIAGHRRLRRGTLAFGNGTACPDGDRMDNRTWRVAIDSADAAAGARWNVGLQLSGVATDLLSRNGQHTRAGR